VSPAPPRRSRGWVPQGTSARLPGLTARSNDSTAGRDP
jgi:hypothetical protein